MVCYFIKILKNSFNIKLPNHLRGPVLHRHPFNMGAPDAKWGFTRAFWGPIGF